MGWQDDAVIKPNSWQQDSIVPPKKEADKPVETAPEPVVADAKRGATEALLQAATGMLAQIPAGLSGIGTLILGQGPEKAAQNVENIANRLTYEPRSKEGQAIAKAPQAAGQAVDKFSDWMGSGVAEKTGSPALGAVAKALPTATAMLLDPAAANAVRGGEAAAVGIQSLPKEVPPTKLMSAEQQHAAAVETLLANDVPVFDYQRSRGATLKSLNRGSDAMLGEGTAPEMQARAFTKAVMRKAGINAEVATPDAMSELKGEIQGTYNDLLARVPTRVDVQMAHELADVRKQIVSEVPTHEQGPLLSQIDNIVEKTQGTGPSAGAPGSTEVAKQPDWYIEGKAAQAQRESLGRMENSQNASVKHFAGELKEILDDAYERSASPEDAQAMRDVRTRFGKMKDIEQAVSGNEAGIITPQKLFSVVSTKQARGRTIYGRGDRDLAELARAGKKVLPDKLGNSGTASRAADAAKISMLGAAHVATLGADLALGLAARKIARGNPAKGTAADVISRANGAPSTPLVRRTVATTANDKETPEQRRRRMLIESLQEKQ